MCPSPLIFWGILSSEKVFPVAQTIENLQSMQEIQVQSLGCEDPLEKGMAIHSSILALRIPWTEDPGQLQSMGSQTVGHNWATNPTKITWRALPDDSFPLPSFRCLLLHRNANPYLYIYHSNSHTILQRLVYVSYSPILCEFLKFSFLYY